MVALSAIEQYVHRRTLSRIPSRIHVSGTRGKSSVTRLVAAGLRAGTLSCLAKTTGTLARIILPDGSERPVYRPGGANIIEQLGIVKLAAKCDAQALVLECMAVKPSLHWVSEHKMVRATHGVITNIRADHLDVMGPTAADVAKAIAGMIPINGCLFTAESRYLNTLQAAAADRNTKLIHIGPDDIAAITSTDMSGFSYVEHRDNLALSLAICQHLGVDRSTALSGMWRAIPDPGALIDIPVSFFGRKITFVNAFAANDPVSTTMAWQAALARHPIVDKKIVIFNLRGDRSLRTKHLAQQCEFINELDHVVLTGSGADTFVRNATKAGRRIDHVKNFEDLSIDAFFERCIGLCGQRSLIVGVGNIGDMGLDITQHFNNRRQPMAKAADNSTVMNKDADQK